MHRWFQTNTIKYFWCDLNKEINSTHLETLYSKRYEFFQRNSYIYDPKRYILRKTKQPENREMFTDTSKFSEMETSFKKRSL